MREIDVRVIKDTVKELCIKANYELRRDVFLRLKESYSRETSVLGRKVIKCLIENANIANNDKLPICQDTGTVNVFITLGTEVKILGGDLEKSINLGVEEAYTEQSFRKSVIYDPLFSRENTRTNTPAILYYSFDKGEKIKIVVLLKGGGSDNASAIKMFTPTDTWDEIKKFVIDLVKTRGINACPPLVVGIGIGGDFSSVPFLTKKAILRDLYSYNPDPRYAKLEKQFENKLNSLGIGPQGLGGKITVLKVNIEVADCHIASLPVAVELQCHALRSASKII